MTEQFQISSRKHAYLSQNKFDIRFNGTKDPIINGNALWLDQFQNIITKTCLFKFDLLKPHFYTVKFGVYRSIRYFCLFLLKSID